MAHVFVPPTAEIEFVLSVPLKLASRLALCCIDHVKIRALLPFRD